MIVIAFSAFTQAFSRELPHLMTARNLRVVMLAVTMLASIHLMRYARRRYRERWAKSERVRRLDAARDLAEFLSAHSEPVAHGDQGSREPRRVLDGWLEVELQQRTERQERRLELVIVVVAVAIGVSLVAALGSKWFLVASLLAVAAAMPFIPGWRVSPPERKNAVTLAIAQEELRVNAASADRAFVAWQDVADVRVEHLSGLATLLISDSSGRRLRLYSPCFDSVLATARDVRGVISSGSVWPERQ